MSVQYSCMFHLLLFSYLELAVKGRNVSLQPSDVRVDVGNWASFNCTLSCDFSQTHTINWFIGESPITRRNVYLSINDVAEREFEEYTGIQIELQDTSNCGAAMSGQEMAQQQLRVFVSAAQAINRTAVQCAALRKDDADVDMYSFYGVILVNGDPESEMSPPSCPTDSTPEDTTTTTTATLPTVQPSACQTVTVTQTVTVLTALPSQLPAPAQGNGASGLRTSSLVLLTVLLTMSLLLQLLFLS